MSERRRCLLARIVLRHPDQPIRSPNSTSNCCTPIFRAGRAAHAYDSQHRSLLQVGSTALVPTALSLVQAAALRTPGVDALNHALGRRLVELGVADKAVVEHFVDGHLCGAPWRRQPSSPRPHRGALTQRHWALLVRKRGAEAEAALRRPDNTNKHNSLLRTLFNLLEREDLGGAEEGVAQAIVRRRDAQHADSARPSRARTRVAA
jgi:hypothetical protein